jgi:hypothetical protein
VEVLSSVVPQPVVALVLRVFVAELLDALPQHQLVFSLLALAVAVVHPEALAPVAASLNLRLAFAAAFVAEAVVVALPAQILAISPAGLPNAAFAACAVFAFVATAPAIAVFAVVVVSSAAVTALVVLSRPDDVLSLVCRC